MRLNGFHKPFFDVAMWITGCHDTKGFWNAYWQSYVKLLRNRPFSPRIIRENLSNLWLGFKTTNFTNHTNDLSWGFLATNFHELFLLNLCEPW